jgi:DNA-binding transcriptional regulator YiaG
MKRFQHLKEQVPVPSNYANLIDRLAAVRTSLGLSQDALADMIGCTASLVHKWEQHKRIPSGFMLTCWFDALTKASNGAIKFEIHIIERND